MLNDQSIINVDLSTGTTIPLRPIRSAKSGNVYHAILNPNTKKASPYGVRVDGAVVGGSLPESIVIGGTTLKGERSVTDDGRNKVRFGGSVSFDGLGTRVVKLSISETKAPGQFNVTGTCHRPGGATKAAVSAL